MMDVHADQDDVYLQYFKSIGVLERARNGAIDFALMDEARTRANYGRLLQETRS